MAAPTPRRRACRCSCINKPREAKRLYLRRDPARGRRVSDLPRDLSRRRMPRRRLGNPVWHIHAGEPPAPELVHRRRDQPGTPISFAMLLNLVGGRELRGPGVLWGFIRRYAPGVSPETHPRLDQLVGYAVRYYPGLRPPGEDATGCRTRSSARRWRSSPRRLPPTKARPTPRRCRPSSTRSGAGISPTPRASRRAPTGAPASPSLVRDDLPGAARRGARPALRLLRRALRRRRDPRADRQARLPASFCASTRRSWRNGRARRRNRFPGGAGRRRASGGAPRPRAGRASRSATAATGGRWRRSSPAATPGTA